MKKPSAPPVPDRANSTTHPDGRPNRWPDGTPRSWGTGFTHCFDGTPHGYRPGSAVAPTPARDRRTSRSALAFGQLNGTYQSTPPVSGRAAGHYRKRTK